MSEQALFLGVNWYDAWRELRKPWQQAHRWPLVMALTPAAPVRLLQADGRESVWSVDAQGATRKQADNGRTRFAALELPEDMLLRRRITLPALNDEATRQAIELEVRSSSPFAAEDLRWGYRLAGATATGGRPVEAVLASHRQISARLMANAERLRMQSGQPEIWARADAHGHIVLSGYGEHQRAQWSGRVRCLAYALLAVIAALAGAIAITPSLQLRLRANEAANAYAAVLARTAPLTQEREALVRAAEQIQVLNTLVQGRADTVEVLDLLTRVLADDTSVRTLQIQGLKVNIEGQTGNAAELMQLLGRQPGFKDVVAPTAATRPFGATKDNFKIEFMLEPRQIADAAPSAAEAASAPAPASAASAPASTPKATTP